MEVALGDREAARTLTGWVFFDRGLIDAASGLQALTGEPILDAVGARHRYHARVFLAPPWPEIYQPDAERRHDVVAARAEYDRLAIDYPSLGYEVIIVPRVSVADRADFVLRRLSPVAPSAT